MHSRCTLFVRDNAKSKTRSKVRNEKLKICARKMLNKKKKANKAIMIPNKVTATVKMYQRKRVILHTDKGRIHRGNVTVERL